MTGVHVAQSDLGGVYVVHDGLEERSYMHQTEVVAATVHFEELELCVWAQNLLSGELEDPMHPLDVFVYVAQV
ncbi:unnamed protein product [Prunus armeniaca]